MKRCKFNPQNPSGSLHQAPPASSCLKVNIRKRQDSTASWSSWEEHWSLFKKSAPVPHSHLKVERLKSGNSAEQKFKNDYSWWFQSSENPQIVVIFKTSWSHHLDSMNTEFHPKHWLGRISRKKAAMNIQFLSQIPFLRIPPQKKHANSRSSWIAQISRICFTCQGYTGYRRNHHG